MAFVAIFVMSGMVSAQPVSELDLTFGGTDDDFAHSVIQTNDGGYAIAGETQSFGAGGRDFWLIKTDPSGNALWTRTFGGPKDDVAYAVIQTADGGLVVAGASAQSTGNKSDFLLVKTDSQGVEQWSRRYANIGLPGILNTQSNDIARAVSQTSDGGFIIVGSSDGQGTQDMWLVKTDAVGALQWEDEYGAGGSEVGFSVQQTADGGYVVAGSTDSVDLATNGGTDFWLLKTDSSGNEQWTNTLGGEFNDEARAVVQTTDGGFALAGITWSKGAGFSDFWLVKTDPDGEEIWNQTYGGVSRDAAYGLQQTQDGGYVLGGWSASFPDGEKFWVVKTNLIGAQEWESTYGEASGQPSGGRAIQQTGDGGFVIAGWTGSSDSGRDIRLVKTKPEDTEPTPANGPVVVLENLGSTEITSAALAFDTSAGNPPHLFGYKGQFLSENNSLPRGAVACTAPIPGLVDGSHMILDQIGTDGVLLIDALPSNISSQGIQTDVTVMTFSLPYETAISGSIDGRYSIVSDSPCTQSTPAGEPSSPSRLIVTTPDTDSESLILDWGDNTEANLIGYNVYLSLAKTGPYGLISASLSQSEYTDTGRFEGTEYYYVVSAVNSSGTESAKSTVTSGIPSDLTPPLAPTGLRISQVDEIAGTVELDWDINADPDLAGYNVYRRLGNEDSFSLIASGVSLSGYLDAEIPAGTDFLFAVSAVDTNGNESDRSNVAPVPLDFFGTVSGFRTNTSDESVVMIITGEGLMEVVIRGETQIQLSLAASAAITDLSRGDVVAVAMVSQNGVLTADKIQVIPGKTQNRHVPGTVTSFDGESMTIQPPGNRKEPITFTLSETVETVYHRGATEISEGSFVVVGAVMDPEGRQLAATEINVTAAGILNQSQSEPSGPPGNPQKSATLRGIFQGVNPNNGNLVVAGIEVPMGGDTAIQAGLVAGNPVKIEAEVLPDGTLLALEVAPANGHGREVSELIRLNGVFDGIDQVTGQWIIGGTLVSVGERANTDGVPRLGQRVKAKALLQGDGSLLAREIENEFGRGRSSNDDNETELEGIFQGTDADGNWTIGGQRIAVDTITRLEGNPAVGRRVAVNAIINSVGPLLALKIRDETNGAKETEREAKIRGVVDQALADGSLVVDGIRVDINSLTELSINPIAGDFVEIKALLQENGMFLARSIEAGLAEGGLDTDDGNPVDIEGEIERVIPDGTLVVNGIQVAISVLSNVQGDLIAGSRVRLRGFLENDGSVLARSLNAKGRTASKSGTEAKLNGSIDRINRNDDGSILSLDVNGLTVAVGALTKTDLDLEAGGSVEITGILINGRFVAGMVSQSRQVKTDQQEGRLEVEGTVSSVERNPAGLIVAVVINGVEIRVSQSAQLRGRIEVGAVIEIRGALNNGVLAVSKLEGKDTNSEKDLPVKFDMEGIAHDLVRDSRGKLLSLVIGGERIAVELLTNGQGHVIDGQTIRIEGLTLNGVLLAAAIVPVNDQDQAESRRMNEEARFKGEPETLTGVARQAWERARDRAAAARNKAQGERQAENSKSNNGKPGSGS